MIIRSPERSDLAKLGYTLEPEDLSPRIPPLINAAVTIPYPERDYAFSLPNNSTISESSHFEFGVNTAASTVATTTTLLKFVRGLWQINATLFLAADFNTAAPITGVKSAFLTWNSPSIASLILLMAMPTANNPQVMQTTFTQLLIDEGWFLEINAPATGVGQTYRLDIIVMATRIL